MENQKTPPNIPGAVANDPQEHKYLAKIAKKEK